MRDADQLQRLLTAAEQAISRPQPFLKMPYRTEWWGLLLEGFGSSEPVPEKWRVRFKLPEDAVTADVANLLHSRWVADRKAMALAGAILLKSESKEQFWSHFRRVLENAAHWHRLAALYDKAATDAHICASRTLENLAEQGAESAISDAAWAKVEKTASDAAHWLLCERSVLFDLGVTEVEDVDTILLRVLEARPASPLAWTALN
jgi:hypothetical protein